LALPLSFFFSGRIFKVVGATLGSALIVEFFLKVEFFSQPFITKCLYLGAQIFAACALYVIILLILGERSAVNAILSKFAKKFRRSK
jgi:hypothetical protein